MWSLKVPITTTKLLWRYFFSKSHKSVEWFQICKWSFTKLYN
uniref:Uncharacterized protein n=1 Tax=Anguilla anguilla TaxID=7936 RepID=A0A0E9Q4F4_ANGAN